MSIRTNYLFQRYSGQGLLGLRWDCNHTFVLTQVKLHIIDLASDSESASVSSSVTGSFADATTDFTIQVDSGYGASYDVVILSEDMSSSTDLLWIPAQPIPFEREDALWFSLATPESWGLEICYRREL